MRVQRSFGAESEEGALYIVGTPIGHLQDLSPRAREILEQVDVIAAEDTRHTRKLLTRFDIAKKTAHQLSRAQPENPRAAIDRAASRRGIRRPGE